MLTVLSEPGHSVEFRTTLPFHTMLLALLLMSAMTAVWWSLMLKQRLERSQEVPLMLMAILLPVKLTAILLPLKLAASLLPLNLVADLPAPELAASQLPHGLAEDTLGVARLNGQGMAV